MKGDAIRLTGFRNEDAAYEWQFVPVDPEYTTIGALLTRFYENFSYSEQPLAWKRDPQTREGVPYYQTAVLLAEYSPFYIVIEKHFNDTYGPHAARLFYRSRDVSSEVIWVAIVQITEMFYSDERMLEALLSHIRARNFFQSEKTAATIVIK